MIIPVAFVLCSCLGTEIPEDKLTIIDNFVLGKPMNDDYSEQMDRLSIPKQRFLTKMVLTDFAELVNENNYLTMYYTSIFNSSKYRNSGIDNLGLLYPLTLRGTKNNVGMVVLLGHTNNPTLFGEAKKYADHVDAKVFRQDVNEEIINEIKQLYKSKYREPKYEYESKYNLVYVVEGNEIRQYSDTSRVGHEIKWETEYYVITYFTGLASYDSRYDNRHGAYIEVILSFGGNRAFPPPKPDPLKDEMQCYSFAYIKYELKQKAIEKLKLTDLKI